VTEEQLAQAVAAMDESAEMDPPPALLLLSRQFGLCSMSKTFSCSALPWNSTQNRGCASKFMAIFVVRTRHLLAMALFEEPAWDAMSPDRLPAIGEC
jgi:hypothetical protein